jgi:murein DD-endopeptidase MepM/ murein hydrolase activator NlpD
LRATDSSVVARGGRRRARHIAAVKCLAVLAAGAAVSCGGQSTPTGPSPGPPGAGIPAVVDCSVFTDSAGSAYVLPWAPGGRFQVSRTFEHYTTANGGVGLYAIDVPMPVGTPIRAARSGRVVAVEERFTDQDRADFHENWVMIRHADDTVARYIHLTANGALVEVGDAVVQGDVIGLSGNSGASTGPHLHFDVQTCGPNLPPGYNRLPCGATVPVSFRNTEPHTCGLEPRRVYTAFPFTPDSR